MDDSERAYLASKHRGGEYNRKGNQYEDYYAVFSILREMSRGHREAIVSSQVEGAYVDDLLIADAEHKTYHQLKNKEKLSWGGFSGSLGLNDSKIRSLLSLRDVEEMIQNLI